MRWQLVLAFITVNYRPDITTLSKSSHEWALINIKIPGNKNIGKAEIGEHTEGSEDLAVQIRETYQTEVEILVFWLAR